MTKHLGPIIAWIIVVGIILYAVRHFSDLRNGVLFIQQSAEEQEIPESIKGVFK